MKNYSKQYLKGLLREYPLLQDQIEARKKAIRNPESHEVDENIGGSSGNRITSVVESVAVKIADDEIISTYEYYHDAINSTLQRSNKDTRKIIELRYFRQWDQKDTSEELGVPISVVRTFENAFLKKLARRLKLMR